jgi:ABC-type nitrate/sulfonate/bicarbonate transport system permease component
MNRKLYHFLGPIIVITIWFIVTQGNLVNPLFVPAPLAVVKEIIHSFLQDDLAGDIFYTLYRVLIGFTVALCIGTPIGLLMGYSKKIYHSLEFVVEFFRSIPVTALFPLFLLIFGIGDVSKIAVTAWTAGFVIIVNSMYGVHLGRELRIKSARSMRVTGLPLFTKVIFPEALPWIINGYRLALSLSLVIVVVTEMFIGTSHGLGHRIIDAQLSYQIPDMYGSILITGTLGYLLNKILIVLEKKIVHWKGK